MSRVRIRVRLFAPDNWSCMNKVRVRVRVRVRVICLVQSGIIGAV